MWPFKKEPLDPRIEYLEDRLSDKGILTDDECLKLCWRGDRGTVGIYNKGKES